MTKAEILDDAYLVYEELQSEGYPHDYALEIMRANYFSNETVNDLEAGL